MCSPLRRPSRSRSHFWRRGSRPSSHRGWSGTPAFSCCPSWPATSPLGGDSPANQVLVTAAPFVIAAVVINVYPFVEGGSTEVLVATHLPVVLVVRRRLSLHERCPAIARAAHGLRPLHRRVVHLLRADRARWRRALGPDPCHPRTDRRRLRAESSTGFCPRGVQGQSSWRHGSSSRSNGSSRTWHPCSPCVFTPLFALMLVAAIGRLRGDRAGRRLRSRASRCVSTP